MDKVVGLVGIGIMGTAMARNLRQAGFTVVGYDPVPAAGARLQEMGGQVLGSPRAVAEAAPIILMSLPNAGALTDTISGADGIAGAAGTGQIVIECSTLPMDIKRAALDAMEKGGKILLDCPISGTGAQAVNKDLVILGSGDKAAFDRCADVFAGMSRVQHYLGAVRQRQRDEVHRQSSGHDQQRGGGGGDAARHEGRDRSRRGLQHACGQRRDIAHVPDARTFDAR